MAEETGIYIYPKPLIVNSHARSMSFFNIEDRRSIDNKERLVSRYAEITHTANTRPTTNSLIFYTREYF